MEGSQTSLFDMTIKEFKEYLDKFNEEDNISLIVLDTEKRKCFKHRDIFLLEDQPAIIFDTNGAEKY